MGRSHALDFEERPITASAVASDVYGLLEEFWSRGVRWLAIALADSLP